MAASDDTRFEALYDHYKDTFTHIRERERRRDRLFLWLVGLLGALFLFADYPQSVVELLGIVTKSDVPKVGLPGFVVTNALWTFVFVAALRYLQAGINVDRQYIYLHRLEDKLAGDAGDEELFRREGRTYGHAYPAFSWWTWTVYAFIFPVLFFLTTTVLIVGEWQTRSQLGGHFWYDLVIYATAILSFVLRMIYRFRASSSASKS